MNKKNKPKLEAMYYYGFDIRNATAETELMWSWLYRKEHKCLPVIDTADVNTIHPAYWKQEGMVEKILNGTLAKEIVNGEIR